MSRPQWFLPALKALCGVSLLLTAAASLWLDRNADRARQQEQALRWAEFVAVLAGQASSQGTVGVEAAVGALAGTQPGLAYLRVESLDGRLVARAGDEKMGVPAVDRTIAGTGGPVRVQVRCAPAYRPLGWAVRAALWVLLLGGFQAAVLVLLGWQVREQFG